MEKKYYTAKDVAELIGNDPNNKSKAYELIRQCNSEILELYKDKPQNEKPLIINGRVNKEYFDKRIGVNI